MSPIGRARKARNRGFLLLEIMVSAAILSFGLVLIVGSFTRSIRAIQLSEDWFRAGLLLEDKMKDIYNIRPLASESGEFPGFDGRFSWKLDAAGSEEGFFDEISLEVFWKQGAKQHSVAIATYL